MGSSRVIVKGVARHLALLSLLCVPVGLAAGQGCTLANDVCDQFCECEHCNDRQEDECVIVVAAARDAAAEYECSDESDKYWECAVAKNDCNDTSFTVDDGCNDERDDLYECIDDGSDIIGSAVNGNNVAQGPPPDTVDGPSGTACSCACTCAMMCSVSAVTRQCGAGEGGCESCDVVCGDACLADAACGMVDTSMGECTPF